MMIEYPDTPNPLPSLGKGLTPRPQNPLGPCASSKGQHPIAPNASVQAALLFNWARGDKSLSEIARAMNTSWAAVQRLENPKHSPNLRQLERAAAILGKRLIINFE